MFILGCFWWVGAVTIAGISIMTLVLSFYPALWFLLISRILGLPNDGRVLPFRALVGYAMMGAAFWVTLEWLRSWFMSGFNWNELGVSQVPCLHLRQLAALGGVPLLTFFLVAFGIFIGEAVWSISHGWWKPGGMASLASAVVLGASWSYGGQRLQHHQEESIRTSISYACIQPDIPELPYTTGNKEEISRLEVQALTVQQDLSARAIADRPELLIWPEAITTQRLMKGSLIDQVIDHLEAYYGGSILLGSEEVDHGKLYNTAYLVAPGRTSLQRYRKVYLVLLGEYIPWTDIFPWLSQWWGRGVSATAGTEPGHLVLEREKLSFAPLMCFEDTQPQVVNAAASSQPDFFVTLINAGWFNGSLATWCLKQHLENAILRCVEHNRCMIRCADTGISCEIDADGRVVAQLPGNSGDSIEIQGILSHLLLLHPWTPTFYEKWGDWVGLLSRWATVGIGFVYLVRMRRGRFGTEK